METHHFSVFSNGQIVRTPSILARVLSCYEVYGVSAPTRHEIETNTPTRTNAFGLPDVCKYLYSEDFTTLTPAWVKYQKDIFRIEVGSLMTDAQIDKAHEGIFAIDRAFTNHKEGEQEALVSAFAKLYLTGETKFLGGMTYWKVLTLDGSSAPPNASRVNQRTYPWLFHRAVISKRTFDPPNENIYENFPQLDGRDVWICNLSKFGVNWIAENRIELL